MKKIKTEKDPLEIFGGNYSEDMWKEINGASSIDELREALYTVCCRLQELEWKLIDPIGYYKATMHKRVRSI